MPAGTTLCGVSLCATDLGRVNDILQPSSETLLAHLLGDSLGLLVELLDERRYHTHLCDELRHVEQCVLEHGGDHRLAYVIEQGLDARVRRERDRAQRRKAEDVGLRPVGGGRCGGLVSSWG